MNHKHELHLPQDTYQILSNDFYRLEKWFAQISQISYNFGRVTNLLGDLSTSFLLIVAIISVTTPSLLLTSSVLYFTLDICISWLIENFGFVLLLQHICFCFHSFRNGCFFLLFGNTLKSVLLLRVFWCFWSPYKITIFWLPT